jgi:DNA-binding response OmpR family regulator
MPTILIGDEAGLFVALEATPILRAGCRLVPVRSAKELVARASTVGPDLVLLDADGMGPGLGDSLRRMKADRRLRMVPIVLAARDPSPLRRILSDTDVIFGKPVGPEEVGAALKRLLPVPRRISARVPVSVPVVCRFGARRVRLRTKDISVGGLFLKTPRHLECGTKFEAAFSLPDPEDADDPRVISAECEVVRRVSPEEPDLIAGVGAVFVRLARSDAGFLRRFVARATS